MCPWICGCSRSRLAISVLSGILFGLTPSLQLSHPNLGAILSDEGRGSAGNRQRNRARSILVAAQVALSMVLLIGSGLLIRSFMQLRTVDPGFEAKNTLTAEPFFRLPVTRSLRTGSPFIRRRCSICNRYLG